MTGLRRTAYNARRRAAIDVPGTTTSPSFRVANELGWERTVFGYRHRQNGEQHVLPLNDLRPHEETRNCWCCPAEYEPGVWGHYALDDRQLVEWGDRMIQ